MATDTAQRWEDGCALDALRNDFLIPQLKLQIEKWRPERILDVGTATAYIPRRLIELGCTNSTWHLVDIDEARLRLARTLLREDDRVTYFQGDFFAANCADFASDLVLLCNTALEFQLDAKKIAHICQCVRLGGHLVVSLPDTSTDAVAAHRAGNTKALDQYILGELVLQKADHFTGEEMPFVAHRTTELICSFVNQGLPMIASMRSDIKNGHYIFVFEKPLA